MNSETTETAEAEVVTDITESVNVDMWQTIEEMNPEALTIPGMEDAIVGVMERCGQPTILVYSVTRCVELLVEQHGMDYDGAVDHFRYNVVGAWLGPNTPGFLYRFDRVDSTE